MGFLSAGKHELIAAFVVVAALLVLCVVGVSHSDREWLPTREDVRAHRKAIGRTLLVALALVLIAVLAPQIHRLSAVLRRIETGDPGWLALGVAIEAVSIGAYVWLTKVLFAPEAPRLNWPASVEITLGGVVATRLLSAAGAGGIAFTAWALRAAGMATRTAARLIAAFLVILYIPYIGAMLFAGLGSLAGGAPRGVAWTGVGAGIVVTVLALPLALVPGDLERRARRLATGHGWVARIGARLSAVPTVAGEALRTGLWICRCRPWVLIPASLWWAADVAVLDVCFRAFGETPPLGTLILGYFLGHIGNLLPLPGGVGGVEGGMIGIFVACNVSTSLAVVATLAYQAVSTWLPAIPGLGAYFSLRRRVTRWREAEVPPPPAGQLHEAPLRG
jgi:uncharacterized membrane protein YbhN (UPF0104 family)